MILLHLAAKAARCIRPRRACPRVGQLVAALYFLPAAPQRYAHAAVIWPLLLRRQRLVLVEEDLHAGRGLLDLLARKQRVQLVCQRGCERWIAPTARRSASARFNSISRWSGTLDACLSLILTNLTSEDRSENAKLRFYM